jgi:hypothetical protein
MKKRSGHIIYIILYDINNKLYNYGLLNYIYVIAKQIVQKELGHNKKHTTSYHP